MSTVFDGTTVVVTDESVPPSVVLTELLQGIPGPSGIPFAQIMTTEALLGGDWVNVYNASGSKVRKASAAVAGKPANGYVLVACPAGNMATVYFGGANTSVTGQTPGEAFLQTTAGLSGPSVPSASGNVVQHIGVAVSATQVNFQYTRAITLA